MDCWVGGAAIRLFRYSLREEHSLEPYRNIQSLSSVALHGCAIAERRKLKDTFRARINGREGGTLDSVLLFLILGRGSVRLQPIVTGIQFRTLLLKGYRSLDGENMQVFWRMRAS